MKSTQTPYHVTKETLNMLVPTETALDSKNDIKSEGQAPEHFLEPIDDACGDAELQSYITRIIDQDQAAFVLLFKAMSIRVHSLAVRITGNIQLAEEVTEDVFFQIWRQAPRFDPARGRAQTWILTIARSRALDARRSIPPFDDLIETDAEAGAEYQNRDSIPDLLLAIEQNEALYSALKSLEPLPRQLIALSFFRGLSHEEIADQLTLPLGTVKSHLRRAVIKLRELLEVVQAAQ